MHIVFLTNEFPKKGVAHGGVGTFVYDIAQKLVKNGMKVSVIGINNECKNEEENENGIHIYRIKKSSWKVAKFIQNSRRVKDLIAVINKKETIDIVEGSELSFAFFPNKTSYKKVIRLHGGHHFFTLELKNKLSRWKVLQEKRSFKIANDFIAVSNYVGSQTQKYLNYNFKYSTIYNSVNTQKFNEAIVSKINKNSLLFVGTVCEKKGIRQLILALPAIKQKFPDVKLVVAGRDWYFKNGDSYVEYLKTFISEELKPHINFLGAVAHAEIPLLIEEAEVCVYPSHMEAMPIAWLEGLLMGKAIVASDIGPGNEAMINNKTGILVNPYSAIEISKGIIEMLSDKEKALEMGKAARKDVLKRFNSEIILKQNIDFYKSITK